MAELSAEQAFAQAHQLLNAGNYAQAGGLSHQLAGAFKDHAPAQLFHAVVLSRLGRYPETIALITNALDLLDKEPSADGDEDNKKAAGQAHNRVTAHFERARAHMAIGDLTAAATDLDAADAIAGQHKVKIGLLSALRARLTAAGGDANSAGATIAPLLDENPVDAEIALAALDLALLDPPAIDRDKAIEVAQAVAARVGLTGDILARLLRAEGDLLDRMGRHDDAFGAWRRACGLSRTQFDPGAYIKALHGFVKQWSPEQMGKIKRATLDDDAPVLIVGMPGRAVGWVGELIAAHPRAALAGALTTLDFLSQSVYGGKDTPIGRVVASPSLIRGEQNEKAGSAYTNRLRSRALSDDHAEAATRLIDTNPLNAAHLGLVALMCPNARIVRVGLDPSAAWLDCWSSVSGFAAPYADDPMHLAAAVRGEATLAAHWRRVFADARVEMGWHEFEWNALTASPEQTARTLIAFLGLEWDDAVGSAANAIAARPMPDPAHYERQLREPAKVLGA